MNNRLSLFCPKCNAWCGEDISVAQLHFAAAHPDDEIPTVEELIEYASMMMMRGLRKAVGALAALAPRRKRDYPPESPEM